MIRVENVTKVYGEDFKAVSNLSFQIGKGEIVGFDDETSYDTKGFEEPEDYWTEQEISDLKLKLTDSINKVLDNKCTDCNE